MEKDVLYLIFVWANNILHREISILQTYTAKAGLLLVNLPFLYPPTPPTLKTNFQKKLRVAGCVL